MGSNFTTEWQYWKVWGRISTVYNNQLADNVELFVSLCPGKELLIIPAFSIGKSDLACTNAEHLDVKEPDTSYV